ncbi:MAG: glycosyltransferase family 4 protein [Patescibacteria group bacterium]
MVIRYVTSLTYPSALANAGQTIKMAEAFAQSIDTELWVSEMRVTREDIWQRYALKKNFPIIAVGRPYFFVWPKSLLLAWRFRAPIQNAPDDTCFYVRDVALAFFLLITSKKFRQHFVFECHSLGKMPSFVYRIIFSFAHGIVSTNEEKKKRISAQYGVTEALILVAPNGFDLRLFEELPSREDAREALAIPQNKQVVLYAGSMQSWKGTDIIPALASQLPEMLFFVVGGPFDEERGNIRMVSAKPYAVIPRYLRAADVLIAPYKDDNERGRMLFSPLKLFEYMASGTPVVATDLPALREIASDADIYFVEKPTATLFVEGIRSALRDKSRATYARDHINKYSWLNRALFVSEFLRGII